MKAIIRNLHFIPELFGELLKLFVMSFPTLLRNVICPLGIKNIKLFKNIKSKMYTLVPFYN